MPGLSNQGRDIETLLRNMSHEDLKAASAAMWTEVQRHPTEASCECPVIEALAVLYELGYALTKP